MDLAQNKISFVIYYFSEKSAHSLFNNNDHQRGSGSCYRSKRIENAENFYSVDKIMFVRGALAKAIWVWDADVRKLGGEY